MSEFQDGSGSGASDRRWLVADQLGSVVAATDSGGDPIGAPNTYDEYGRPGAANSGRFQYTGQMWLAEVSVYHYKARAYNPALGAFLQTDPILYAGGMNLYAYVGADPVNFTDPLGLQDRPPSEDDPIVVIGGGFSDQGVIMRVEAWLTGPPTRGVNIARNTETNEAEIVITARCRTVECLQAENRRIRNAASSAYLQVLWDNGLVPAFELYLAIETGRLAFRLGGLFASADFVIPAAKAAQVARRGWTADAIGRAIRRPVATGRTVDRATGQPATAYFVSHNQYVVRNDVTGQIVQVSDLRNPNWMVDRAIRVVGGP